MTVKCYRDPSGVLPDIIRVDIDGDPKDLDALAKILPNSTPEARIKALPRIFGGSFFSRTIVPVNIPFKVLERLVRIALSAIRPEDDNKRPAGEAYSPDIRDDAEQARSAAFKQLIDTPGRATYDAILRLESTDYPISSSRLKELAFNRAATDSEAAVWVAGELKSFEETHEMAPRTAKDLQSVALRRLADAQNELLDADFDQGSMLKMLHTEPLVQKWVGHWLRQKQGRSYSIEREPEVADEKNPDVRFRAKASDANVAMEIKVAESCTLEKLEEALEKQLCNQYLRASEGRYGILLLVHQHTRSQGWKQKKTGRILSFAEVVNHLKAIALRISGDSTDAPQPEICLS